LALSTQKYLSLIQNNLICRFGGHNDPEHEAGDGVHAGGEQVKHDNNPPGLSNIGKNAIMKP
jgi:hypothetical protein